MITNDERHEEFNQFLQKEYGSFIGKTVKYIRPMTQQELNEVYWNPCYSDVPMVIVFDDGQAWIPSSDPEANGPGFLLTADVE